MCWLSLCPPPACLSLVLWAHQDLDKTQEDVLKHQASISELKRSFMEATPDPMPSQWDKRLTGSPATTLRLQAQGVRVLLLGIRTPPQTLCMSCTSCPSRSALLRSWFTVFSVVGWDSWEILSVSLYLNELGV